MPLHQPLVAKAKQIIAIAPTLGTEILRSSPLVSGAALGGTGLILGAGGGLLVAQQIKRKRVKTRVRQVTRRRKAKVRTTRRRVSHRTPRHRGHKRVTFTTKEGKKVRFLVRGAKRSPQHRRRTGRTTRRFVKGSPEAKRFMAKLRRMRR